MSDLFDSLTALQAEWQALQPLHAEHQERLWRKFRLEWNYHSNHIEGNTLTYGETELLLLHDRTTGNHSHREYLEMKAHDVGIEHIRTLAADSERIITEADIRDLNKIILKEPFWKPAETADGQATRKQIIPGEYKTSPNNVRTATGEMFYFASVEDAQPKMQALAAWLRQELEMPTLHPVALASKLHHDFVLIHPFDDGNGRVARLLVNYVLLRTGYLPVIVRSDDKVNYLTALRLADAGELLPLTEYLARLEEWSLGIGISAGRGEPIEEAGDVEKEVALFVRDQQATKRNETGPTRDKVKEIIGVSVGPFFDKLAAKLEVLSKLFKKTLLTIRDGLGNEAYASIGFRGFSTIHAGPGEEIIVSVAFENYQGAGVEPFSFPLVVGVQFRPSAYRITHEGEIIVERNYSTLILAEEAEALSSRLLAKVFQHIKDAAESLRTPD